MLLPGTVSSGFADEVFEFLLVPNEVCAPHGARIRVVWQRTRFPSYNAAHVRSEPIVALLGRVACSAVVVEHLLARCDVCFWGQFLGRRRP